MDKAIAAEVAARWWTDQIRQASRRYIGDKGSPAHKGQPGHLLAVNEQHLSVFEQALRVAIIGRIKDGDWREDNPIWASSIRVIGADYGPDLTLAQAFTAAGISTLLCPTKTYMWIDPDRVHTNSGFEWMPEC